MCSQQRNNPSWGWSRAGEAAFTLVEVVMGVALMGILSVSLYAGLSLGFAQVSLAREEERATQILMEKMEVVRLLSWDQLLNLPGYVPDTFSEPFYSDNPTSTPSGSLIYTGTVAVKDAPVLESYRSELRLIEIGLTWQSGNLTHRRRMTTFISKNGLQKYIY
jgi:prepilin-type N-terminal cleavage/methylation domain-containing protein